MDYKGYNILKDGTVYKDGKLIATNRIYVNGSWQNGIDLANKLFSEVNPKTVVITKEHKNKALRKLTHGNTGLKRTDIAKERMSKAKQKRVIINGVPYKSITEASENLQVHRSTIYRRFVKT